MRKLLLLLTALAALLWASLVVLSQRPGEVGLVRGALRASADPDQALNSQMGSPESRTEPLYVGSEVERAWSALLQALPTASTARLRGQEADWVALSWRTMPWGISVDLEVLKLAGAEVLHVRSASRLGTFGLGMHRRALAQLRELLAEALVRSDAP